jgi:hypothetical protein
MARCPEHGPLVKIVAGRYLLDRPVRVQRRRNQWPVESPVADSRRGRSRHPGGSDARDRTIDEHGVEAVIAIYKGEVETCILSEKAR